MSFSRPGALGRGFGRLGSGGRSGSAVIVPGVITAGGGSYAWTGDDATPVQNHIIAGAGSSYAWTGQDATLTKSGGATATFNPSDKGANISLSGGDLIATNAVTGNRNGVRSTTSHSSGKYYFEATMGGNDASYAHSIGLASGTANLSSTSIGDTADSGSLFNGDVQFYTTGGSGSTGISYNGTSHVVCVAVDLDNDNIWYRIGAGDWNNSGSNDPATNTGGKSISALTADKPLFVLCTADSTAGGGSANSVQTYNFGGSAYSHTPPSGFGNW